MNTNNYFNIQKHILRNLHRYCISISIISFVFICVDEKLIPGFVPCLGCINPAGVNGVVSVIGCSFIAGYLFYLLTNVIPNFIRNKETNKLVFNHLKILYSWVEVCKEPIAQLNSLIKDMKDDEVYYLRDPRFINIYNLIKKIDEEAKPLVINSIQPIYRYFTYLTPNQQKKIESINRSELFLWSNYLKNKEQLYIKEVKIMINHYNNLTQL